MQFMRTVAFLIGVLVLCLSGAAYCESGFQTRRKDPDPKGLVMAVHLEITEPKNNDGLKDFAASFRNSLWRKWLERMPESAQLGDSGIVIVRFQVEREEPVSKMSVEQSPGKKMESFERAALEAIRDATKRIQLPQTFAGSTIGFRAKFFYNQPAETVKD
jgi:TonB family protein